MNDIMAVKILPNIYLGDKRAAYNLPFFEKENITAVLNITPYLHNMFCRFDHIEYLRIPIFDSFEKRDPNKLLEYFPIITEFIYKNSVLENKNILIHCNLGMQRSTISIAAYLIRYYKMTPTESIEFIVNRKNNAFHNGKNVNFLESINKWYDKISEKIL
jgi:protein-tyrosine phosphatase